MNLQSPEDFLITKYEDKNFGIRHKLNSSFITKTNDFLITNIFF